MTHIKKNEVNEVKLSIYTHKYNSRKFLVIFTLNNVFLCFSKT